MKHILLLGGGHAHAAFLHKLRNEKRPRYKVTCLSPSALQYYSGMFSGLAEGLYDEEDLTLNLEVLCQKSKAVFIKDSAIKIHPLSKQVETEAGKIISFDILSINIGSLTNFDFHSNDVLAIKPVWNVPNRIHRLIHAEFPVIAGGGAAGVELALSAAAYRQKNGFPANLTLISTNRVLESQGVGRSRKISAILAKSGVKVLEHEDIVSVEKNVIQTKHLKIGFDCMLAATGPRPHPFLKESGIPCNHQGYISVNSKLQSQDFPYIFGAGDCITLISHPNLPKNGVYAVRQAPFLFENIKRYMSGEKLLSFKPQKSFVSILSTGQKRAFFMYGRFSFHHHLAWRIKHSIDQRYMEKMRE